MAFGIYVHIPYCIQRCKYCDFATYEQSQIMPPDSYLDLLFTEISATKHWFGPRFTDTIYFGGGTPSLLPAEKIVSILSSIEKAGFTRGPGTEITLEINPATINEQKMEIYLQNGINRFSVGAQTFKDSALKMLGREHNSQQTQKTLELLQKYNANFTFDLLFALPGQTISDIQNDIQVALSFGAKHISTYCLTVPDSNPLAKGRPAEADQIKMFELIHSQLQRSGYQQYEISNYAVPGFESRHNILYWSDQPYWGIGLSAHSYRPSANEKVRFWNPSQISQYEKFWAQKHELQGPTSLPDDCFEVLAPHQYATDFCHTSLRMMRGLSVDELNQKFSPNQVNVIKKHIVPLQTKGLLCENPSGWRLTAQGIYLSNLVFSGLTFLEKDFSEVVD